MRMWDDYEHDKLDPAGHRGPAIDGKTGSDRYAWVVAGIHYDRPQVLPAKCAFGVPVVPCRQFKMTHVPGRSWNVARHEMRRALHRVCGQRAWKLHAGARGWYQGFYSTGYLARMTLRDKAEGCAGSGP